MNENTPLSKLKHLGWLWTANLKSLATWIIATAIWVVTGLLAVRHWPIDANPIWLPVIASILWLVVLAALVMEEVLLGHTHWEISQAIKTILFLLALGLWIANPIQHPARFNLVELVSCMVIAVKITWQLAIKPRIRRLISGISDIKEFVHVYVGEHELWYVITRGDELVPTEQFTFIGTYTPEDPMEVKKAFRLANTPEIPYHYLAADSHWDRITLSGGINITSQGESVNISYRATLESYVHLEERFTGMYSTTPFDPEKISLSYLKCLLGDPDSRNEQLCLAVERRISQSQERVATLVLETPSGSVKLTMHDIITSLEDKDGQLPYYINEINVSVSHRPNQLA